MPFLENFPEINISLDESLEKGWFGPICNCVSATFRHVYHLNFEDPALSLAAL